MNEEHDVLIYAVKRASQLWQNAFNSGNAKGCAALYEDTAIMHARPFGEFVGTQAIEGFWQKLIKDDYRDVQYINPKIEVVDDTSAILTAGWTMNMASGIIHKELWVLQDDGTAKLREDDFEATG